MRGIVLAAAVAVLLLGACSEGGTDIDPLVVELEAPGPRFGVCHVTGGGSYRYMLVGGKPLASHLAHGDPRPGDVVGGYPLGPNCEVHPDSEGGPLNEVCHLNELGSYDYLTLRETPYQNHLAHGDSHPGDVVGDARLGPMCEIEAILDTDGDGIPDDEDPDDDNDGQSDLDETACGSDPLDDTSLSPDLDGDGTPDCVDSDDDDDGVDDDDDAFPDDPTEWLDTDGDGTGDNADADDDNDGQSDVDETACGSDPLDDTSLSPDLDGDGTPDCIDSDDDGDGVDDDDDAFPDDPTEWADNDGDGTGDNADTDDDDDGQTDDEEIACGSDPLNAADMCDAGAPVVCVDGSTTPNGGVVDASNNLLYIDADGDGTNDVIFQKATIGFGAPAIFFHPADPPIGGSVAHGALAAGTLIPGTLNFTLGGLVSATITNLGGPGRLGLPPVRAYLGWKGPLSGGDSVNGWFDIEVTTGAAMAQVHELCYSTDPILAGQNS